jgi:ribosomal-protein-alanine N-acetyltransferase
VKAEIDIRRASLHDLDEILAVERACEDAPHWSANQYADFLQATSDRAHQKASFVAVDGQQVVGFSIASLIAGEVELESVAVLPGCRRQGLGRRLCEAVFGWARASNAEKVLLEVRSANQGAQALYRELGFVKVGLRKNYYTNPIDDAVQMAATL